MWPMAKRILLFLTVNILVLTTLTIAWSIVSAYFGLEPNTLTTLLGFSLVFGMGGAFVSLFLSKLMAKWMFRIQIVDPRSPDPQLRQLVQTVHEMARRSNLPKPPEVGIYDSPEVNAFATGPSKRSSLVAVSSGLLQRMRQDEVEGVLAHEIAHISNGDMVTMTLIQGIINALVIFLARVVAGIVAGNADERARPMMHFALVIGLQIVFSILGSIVVNWFSRAREYRADAGGAHLAGKDKMIAALRRLQSTVELVDHQQQAVQTLKISGGRGGIMAMLFATHPSLDERIKRLEQARG